MRLARMGAGGKGVQPLDAVRQPVFHQKLQRAVCHRRLVAEPLGRQPSQHVIGPQRAVVLQEDFQHPAAHRRQPRTGRFGHRLGTDQRIRRAMGVVMRSEGRIGRGMHSTHDGP
jgi:hypothetical protein